MAVDAIERTRVRNKIIDQANADKKERNLIIGVFKPCSEDVCYCYWFVRIVFRSNEIGSIQASRLGSIQIVQTIDTAEILTGRLIDGLTYLRPRQRVTDSGRSTD